MMPRKLPARKISCNNCGWSKKEPATTVGDCLTPMEMARSMPVRICPKCASSNVATKENPSLGGYF